MTLRPIYPLLEPFLDYLETLPAERFAEDLATLALRVPRNRNRDLESACARAWPLKSALIADLFDLPGYLASRIIAAHSFFATSFGPNLRKHAIIRALTHLTYHGHWPFAYGSPDYGSPRFFALQTAQPSSIYSAPLW